MTAQQHCDFCGEVVTDFYDDGGLQMAFRQDDGTFRRPNVPAHAKEQYGAFKGCFVWPTRAGIGCSCNRKRRKEVNQ